MDQFGDARLPAACCGVFSFKPTSSRMSSVGIHTMTPRSPICNPVVSPIARSVKDIIYLLRCVWDSKTQLIYDKTVTNQAYNPDYLSEQMKPRALTIGYYFDDGLIGEVSEANRQAVLLVKNALELQGHTLLEFSLLNGTSNFLEEGLSLAY